MIIVTIISSSVCNFDDSRTSNTVLSHHTQVPPDLYIIRIKVWSDFLVLVMFNLLNGNILRAYHQLTYSRTINNWITLLKSFFSRLVILYDYIKCWLLPHPHFGFGYV